MRKANEGVLGRSIILSKTAIKTRHGGTWSRERFEHRAITGSRDLVQALDIFQLEASFVIIFRAIACDSDLAVTALNEIARLLFGRLWCAR